jgi:hypothetical protein
MTAGVDENGVPGDKIRKVSKEGERKGPAIGRDRVPEEWIGRTVIVEVKGRRGGSYLILGRLQNLTDEEVTIDRQSPERITERIRSYPWESVVEVRLPEEP